MAGRIHNVVHRRHEHSIAYASAFNMHARDIQWLGIVLAIDWKGTDLSEPG